MKTIGVKTNLRDDDNVAQARPETNHDSESSISSTTFDENDIQVYRFKLAPNVQELVTVFAKIHQYDTRKDFLKEGILSIMIEVIRAMHSVFFVSDCMVADCIVLLFHPFNIFPNSREQNCRHGDFQQVSRNEGIQS